MNICAKYIIDPGRCSWVPSFINCTAIMTTTTLNEYVYPRLTTRY